jgi:putative transposase
MKGKRKQHTAAFKAQVALATLKGDKTVNELASHYGVHPTLIHGWKKQLLVGADQVFSNGTKAATVDAETEKAELFEQIGRLRMELEWLKKKSDRSPERLRPLVEADHAELSVRRQCALLGLSRASLYYAPVAETAENLRLMRLLDREYTAHPFLGSRRLTAWLITQGEEVNRKRVQRLMRLMGLEAIYPKPKLSAAGRGHRLYPYLLRNVSIQRPNQVWSTDITY